MDRWIRLAAAGLAVALAGCGGGGGGGGGTPTTAPVAADIDDLSSENFSHMTGLGGAMVHVDIVWRARDARPAENVVVELQRLDGTPVAGTRRTIPRIVSGQKVAVHVHAQGFADGERLVFVIDPANAIHDDVRANNRTGITIVDTPLPALSDTVDLQFADCHYHQAYYFNNLALHFYAADPLRWNIAREQVKYRVYDDGVAIFSSDLSRDIRNLREHGETPGGYLEIYLPPETFDAVRPAPNRRHVITVHLDPDGSIPDLDPANNWMRFVIDMPGNAALPPPTDQPDVIHQDPHFHQYAREHRVRFHFFIRNDTTGTTAVESVRWRLVREDGVEILPLPGPGQATTDPVGPIAPRSQREIAFDHLDDTSAEVGYELILDPGGQVTESHEDNNRVRFIIDWSPTGFG